MNEAGLAWLAESALAGRQLEEWNPEAQGKQSYAEKQTNNNKEEYYSLVQEQDGLMVLPQ